jgi:hypothetical protein
VPGPGPGPGIRVCGGLKMGLWVQGWTCNGMGWKGMEWGRCVGGA